MSCYVDDLCGRGWILRGRSVFSCHLISDSPAELHLMARAIGLDREWFQPLSSPHYDLTSRRRAKAVELGAQELDRAAFVGKLRELRKSGSAKAERGRLQAAVVEAAGGVATEWHCRECGCTDADGSACAEKTGEPCWWIEADLCSACRPAVEVS